jgi:hypothetical protein
VARVFAVRANRARRRDDRPPRRADRAAEYRNGGLLIDTGVLTLADPRVTAVTHDVGSELVVEWRALTVSLLDELAPRVRSLLGVPALSLASMLEGGTWAAGRGLARQLRGGEPPLKIAADGTVF